MMPSKSNQPPSKPGGAPREPAEGSREVIEHELAKDDLKKREVRIDKSVDLTFPASDPAASGHATGTEPPARPTDRQAPVVTREQIERASRGASRDPLTEDQRNAGGVSASPALAPGDDAAPGTPGTGEDICPRCLGSGTANGGTCPVCQGSGKVTKGIGGA